MAVGRVDNMPLRASDVADSPTAAQKNYAKLDSGTYRAVRGGSYDNTAKLVSAAARTGMMPTIHYDTVGFRCARNLR